MTLARRLLLNAALALQFLGLASPADAAAAADAGVVLVVDRVGDVTLWPGTETSRPIATLAALPVDARVRLAPGARLTVLYVSTGEQFAIAGPGEAAIGAAGVTGSAGASAERRVANAAPPTRLRSDAIAMGGVVMRGAGLRARYPAGLLTAPPTRFVWDSLAVDARYRVELRDSAGTVLHAQAVQGLSLPFPEALGLHADERYTWSVAPDLAATPARIASAHFELAPETLRAEARQAAPAAGAAFADRLVYGLWLEQVGALGEARQVWQALAEERPDDPALAARAKR